MHGPGSEAIIWYFLLEQLQTRGNYRPAGRGQGRVSLGTLSPPPPPQSQVEAGHPACLQWPLGMEGLAPGKPFSAVGHSGLGWEKQLLARSLMLGERPSAVLSSVLGILGAKGNDTWTRPQGACSQ